MLDQLTDRLHQRLRPAVALHPRADSCCVRVLTYNTHHGADRADVLDVEAIARTIESCDPDIVALQEVDRFYGNRSGQVDQPSWYAKRLGLHVHYAANLVRQPAAPGKPPAEYGLATLSRLPFTSVDQQIFRAPSAEPRGLTTAVVEMGSGGDGAPAGIRVINTHLSVHDRRACAQEMAELCAYADQPDQLPTVVVGDFNASPRAFAVRAMRQRYTDAWDVGRGPSRTIGRRRIDYIWCSRQLRPLQATVVRSPASDHDVLVADLGWD